MVISFTCNISYGCISIFILSGSSATSESVWQTGTQSYNSYTSHARLQTNDTTNQMTQLKESGKCTVTRKAAVAFCLI